MTEIRQRFIKKHVTNQYQLRRFLPRRYLDNTHETGILVDSYSVIIGTMVSCDNHKYGDRQSFIKIYENIHINTYYADIPPLPKVNNEQIDKMILEKAVESYERLKSNE